MAKGATGMGAGQLARNGVLAAMLAANLAGSAPALADEGAPSGGDRTAETTIEQVTTARTGESNPVASTVPTQVESATLKQAKKPFQKVAAAPSTITVGTTDSGAKYDSLKTAIENAQSGSTIKVITDIEASEQIAIDAGKKITIIGNANPALNSQGTVIKLQYPLVVNGGSLTLGDGTEENAITLVDGTSAGSSALVTVSNGGSLTIKDGATIKRPTASSYPIVQVGNDSSPSSETATFTGEGGSVSGGAVHVIAGGEGAISGGTYLNTNGEALVVAAGGRVSSISGGSFTGTTGLACYGTVGTIAGTDENAVAFTGTGTSSNDGGILIASTTSGAQGKIGSIGHASISGISGGLQLITPYNSGSATLGKLSNSTVTSTGSSGRGIYNGGTITDGVYACTVTARKTGIYNTAEGTIGTISGGTVSVTGQKSDSLSVNDFAGIFNNNGIITNGITGSNVTSTSLYGIYNTASYPYSKGKIGSISNCTVTADGTGTSSTSAVCGVFNANGSIPSISESSVKGVTYGLLNNGSYASIETVSGSTFEGSIAGIRNGISSSSGAPSSKLTTIGEGNVLLATGATGWGFAYLNDSSTSTAIEPVLKNSGKSLGTGRYYGLSGAFGQNSSGASNVFPDSTSESDARAYHMATAALRGDVAAYPSQRFQYLKLPFTLSYDANAEELPNDDGTAAAYAMSGAVQSRVESGDGEAIAIAACGYDYGHHVFRGWNTKKDGSGDWYRPDAQGSSSSATIALSDDTTLYAQWGYDDHTLTFSYNGGLNGEGTGDDTSVTVSGHGVLGCLPAATRDGYRFGGWYVDEGLMSAFDPNQNIVRDATLYARWSPYVVRYDKNAEGASGEMAASVPSDGNSLVTVLASAYTRDGYSFTGWNTKADGTGETVASGELAEPLSSDVTLYAQWERVPEPEPEPDPDPEPESESITAPDSNSTSETSSASESTDASESASASESTDASESASASESAPDSESSSTSGSSSDSTSASELASETASESTPTSEPSSPPESSSSSNSTPASGSTSTSESATDPESTPESASDSMAVSESETVASASETQLTEDSDSVSSEEPGAEARAPKRDAAVPKTGDETDPVPYAAAGVLGTLLAALGFGLHGRPRRGRRGPVGR